MEKIKKGNSQVPCDCEGDGLGFPVWHRDLCDEPAFAMETGVIALKVQRAVWQVEVEGRLGGEITGEQPPPPHPARDPAFRTPSLEPLLESNQLQAWQSRMSADESLDDWLNWPHARKCHILFIFIIKNFCYWSMVVLQCDVSFCCIANWVSYTHKYTPVCHHRALARVPCAM